jgi:antitoxin (DNA-binding transcriptional repressor) of toxin-antitoxin stability system
MVHKIPITKARINLGSLVKRVYLKGETFLLEKNDIPIAALVPIGQLKPTRKRSASKKRK